MTTDLQDLGRQVALTLLWFWDDHDDNWQDKNGAVHYAPSDPAECFKLCAEFQLNVLYWSNKVECQGSHEKNHRFSTEAPHDNTPTGRLNAAIEAVLLAVLAIKEQS